ncbi:MAG: helix-turn-helix domain-containing protein [Lachnospiraceae bacterium]|nr:helix-turn-helix domain-containing protein [Lachnospiraceae bacterium]
MTNKEFAERISQLRIEKGVSARDMSLTLGLSETYINRIENGKMMPSMPVFFEICDYFAIEPNEFFLTRQNPSAELLNAFRRLNSLTRRKQQHVIDLINDL